MLGDLELAVVVPLVDLAAKADLDRVVLLRDEPDVAHLQPVVRQLHLPAVDDLLLEDAELIADREAGGRVAETGQGVEIAGGQPSETAVAEAGVGVEGVELLDVDVQGLEGFGEDLFHAEIVEIVAQARADQEFHRHVVDLLAAFLLVSALEGAAAVIHAVSHDGAKSLVGLLVGGFVHVAAEEPHTCLVQKLDRVGLIHSSSI